MLFRVYLTFQVIPSPPSPVVVRVCFVTVTLPTCAGSENDKARLQIRGLILNGLRDTVHKQSVLYARKYVCKSNTVLSPRVHKSLMSGGCSD